MNIPLFSQNGNVLKWEQLAVCLPNLEKVSDLRRGEVSGDNDPEAIVSILYYNSPEIMERSKEIQIIIGDYLIHQESLEEALTEAPDISKPILINEKYKGVKIIATYDSVVDYCTYHIVVAGRFLITFHSSTDGDFTKEIEMLIANIDYAKLEKLK